MTKRRTLTLALAAAAGLVISMTLPAQAQSSRTWVSGTGNDGNPCTRTSPCLTFAGAYANTAAFGEINCLDEGSFGPLLIDKSITISCEVGTAGVIGHGASGYAIAVQVGSSDIVYLRGLDLEGLSTTNAGNSTYGIVFTGTGTLHVEKCLIRGYTGIGGQAGNGIAFLPSGAASLFVSDTTVANNGVANSGGNVLIAPTGGGLVNVALKNVRMANGTFGLRVADNASATVHASVGDSVAFGNSSSGFFATTAGGRLTMLLEHSTAANNGTVGIQADGANTELHLATSQVFGNSTGLSATNSGLLVSYKNNEIKLNGSNGSPTSIVTLD